MTSCDLLSISIQTNPALLLLTTMSVMRVFNEFLNLYKFYVFCCRLQSGKFIDNNRFIQYFIPAESHLLGGKCGPEEVIINLHKLWDNTLLLAIKSGSYFTIESFSKVHFLFFQNIKCRGHAKSSSLSAPMPFTPARSQRNGNAVQLSHLLVSQRHSNKSHQVCYFISFVNDSVLNARLTLGLLATTLFNERPNE